MSTRQELAQRIADFIRDNRLTTPYGGDVVRQKNYYTVLFSDVAGGTGCLDGAVDVWGEKFIQISYQTQYRAMPSQAWPVFESEAATIDFLNKAFVIRDFDAALAIPTKAR
jgi:hypothetical protein